MGDYKWAADRIAELEAEVERLRADAERYRWLRKYAEVRMTNTGFVYDIDKYPEDLDVAIDASREVE